MGGGGSKLKCVLTNWKNDQSSLLLLPLLSLAVAVTVAVAVAVAARLINQLSLSAGYLPVYYS